MWLLDWRYERGCVCCGDPRNVTSRCPGWAFDESVGWSKLVVPNWNLPRRHWGLFHLQTCVATTAPPAFDLKKEMFRSKFKEKKQRSSGCGTPRQNYHSLFRKDFWGFFLAKLTRTLFRKVLKNRKKLNPQKERWVANEVPNCGSALSSTEFQGRSSTNLFCEVWISVLHLRSRQHHCLPFHHQPALSQWTRFRWPIPPCLTSFS